MMHELICSLIGHRRATAREVRWTSASTMVQWEQCPRCGRQHQVEKPHALLVRIVGPAYLIPRHFGVAWVRWQTGDAVCVPIPLNVAAAAGRRAWYWVRHPRQLVADPRQAYLQGYAQGLRASQRDRGPTP